MPSLQFASWQQPRHEFNRQEQQRLTNRRCRPGLAPLFHPNHYAFARRQGSTFDKKMKRFCAGMIRSASTCLGRPVGYFPRYLGTNTAHAGLGSKNPHLHTTFPGRYRFSHIGVDLAAPGRCPDMMRRNTEDHEIRLGPKLRAFNPATKRIFWQVASIDFA